MNDTSSISVPLYHGTSTLFLEDILTHGLGAKDPLTELNLFQFIADLHPLIEAHLSGTTMYRNKTPGLVRMMAQSSGGLNYQHGESYLSTSKDTAIGYTVNKSHGSELLSYALNFLQELVNLKLPAVNKDLYQKYKQVFALLDISPAPILIQADGVPTSSLLTEGGTIRKRRWKM